MQWRAQGMRVTPQRQVVWGLLVDNHTHPTVDALYDQARQTLPTISRKTVYQAVHELAEAGQIEVLDLGTGTLRVDPNVEGDHQHLVCTTCGKIQDVVTQDPVTLPGEAQRNFRVESIDVIYRGLCQQCSREQSKEK